MPHTATTVDTTGLTDRITRTPFPGSAKIYIEGSRPDIRVPFREVTLTDTLVATGKGEPRREANPALRLYDPSGVYTDPAQAIDITRGLPPLRAAFSREFIWPLRTAQVARWAQRHGLPHSLAPADWPRRNIDADRARLAHLRQKFW